MQVDAMNLEEGKMGDKIKIEDGPATAVEEGSEMKVIYKFCDLKASLVEAWKNQFEKYIPDRVKVYQGDIFKDGPSADAIVSPANSFGFMDGGIDMVYSRHFGWQMQERLQKLIRKEYNGELLVGQAAIITAVEKHNCNTVDWSKYNEGQPITYLISAPTMRVPCDVSQTSNAYLAFRGIILAVQKFNASKPQKPIKSVLCPGLGTAVGFMPSDRCAFQMLRAFETFELGIDTDILSPNNLMIPVVHSCEMTDYKGATSKGRPPKDQLVMKMSSTGKTTTLGSKSAEKDEKSTDKIAELRQKLDSFVLEDKVVDETSDNVKKEVTAQPEN